jgi:hypothetical protein
MNTAKTYESKQLEPFPLFDGFEVREMLRRESPPWKWEREWKDSPTEGLIIHDKPRFHATAKWDLDKLEEADELLLWKIYARLLLDRIEYLEDRIY